jgi:hypothetical protein
MADIPKQTFKITDPGKGSLFIEDDAGSVVAEFPHYSLDRDFFITKIVRMLNGEDF